MYLLSPPTLFVFFFLWRLNTGKWFFAHGLTQTVDVEGVVDFQDFQLQMTGEQFAPTSVPGASRRAPDVEIDVSTSPDAAGGGRRTRRTRPC